MSRTIVGIYKIPALWDTIDSEKFVTVNNINYDNNNTFTEFKEHNNRITNIQNNVYFELFKKIAQKTNSKEKHYVFIDENQQNNKKCLVDTINIWILKSHYDLCYFREADIFFLRGNYLNYYNNYINNKKIVYFYPATSIVYDYYIDNKLISRNTPFIMNNKIKMLNKNKLNHSFYKKIDIVFIHENSEYLNIFNNVNKKILFNKPASLTYKFLNLKRKYDFIFIGDAVQSTKNHHLIFHFINYCETCNISLKILYISDQLILKEKYKNFISKKELKNIDLTYDNYLTPEKLNIYMNESKINLIFSGRDAFPRTITETLYAGCYNIALDTLSDGKNIFIKPYGEIIGDKNLPLELLKSKSLSYINNKNLWNKILDVSKQKFDHKNIAIEAKKNFSYDLLLQ